MSSNLYYSLEENKDVYDVSYDDILTQVDTLTGEEDDINDQIEQELDYQTTYTKRELERILEYYGISKKKKNKCKMAEDIVLFEKTPVNITKVYQRIKLWKYVEEIKMDDYLSQFLILE